MLYWHYGFGPSMITNTHFLGYAADQDTSGERKMSRCAVQGRWHQHELSRMSRLD